jgi:hypothetical protein
MRRSKGTMDLSRIVAALALALVSTGCATLDATVRFAPNADGSVEEVVIPGLRACDEGIQSATLDPTRPVNVLVHGCNSSTAKFKTLAKVFAAGGQQAVCFSYDDRDYLKRSSAKLVRAIEALEQHMQSREIVVLGHSQGGLVTRNALTRDRRDGTALAKNDFQLRLVTVSSPFAGIQSSKHCGSILAYVLSFGLTPGICQIIAGAKWREIFPGSGFIRNPGTLVEGVVDHVKVDTDEEGACSRVKPSGRCAQSDFVFSLPEQLLGGVDEDKRVDNNVIKSGHVEIVGESGQAPVKLIAVLQEHGILAPVPPGQEQAFAALLEDLYR